MITAIIATTSWKKEIKSKKKKELADKLLEYVEYTEYLLVPTKEMNFPSLIYDKMLEKFGVHCQDTNARLKKIYIELSVLRQEYDNLNNKKIKEILIELESTIQSKLRHAKIDGHLTRQNIKTIKDFCLQENKGFYN